MSSFDAAAFLNSTVTEPMSTQITPVDEGEYQARIDDGDKWLDLREVKGTKDASKSYTVATIWWNILDQQLKDKLGREKVLVKQDLWLDFDSSGRLSTEKEKNVALGQVREALGMNEGVFSPGMLRGAGPAMIKVSQRSDKDNPERKYSEVTRVTALR